MSTYHINNYNGHIMSMFLLQYLFNVNVFSQGEKAYVDRKFKTTPACKTSLLTEDIYRY